MRPNETVPDPYMQLALYLDELPAGYPPTVSGVERQILRKLFSEEEARLAMNLTLIPEDAHVVALRAHQPVAQVAKILDGMDRKGLIASNHTAGKPPRYAISQFVVGFYEGQVNRLDKEFVELIEAYLPQYFEMSKWSDTPQLRTIPIGESIPITTEVMPYESIEAILRAKTDFAVRNCICRQEQEIMGHSCDKPVETCLTFNQSARDDAVTGKGRLISLDEALNLVEKAKKAGLVLQPANSKNPVFLCTCCDCCCGVLRQIKKHPHPASLVDNAFIARQDRYLCTNCGACTEICPMQALCENSANLITLQKERCIGCGLCVSVCPSGALAMVRKPGAEQPQIPKKTINTYQKIAQARGKWRLWPLIGMGIRSIWHRIIARM
jgi:Na+-translocating ferredoxin:NAD+ oxidoreductase subunit B